MIASTSIVPAKSQAENRADLMFKKGQRMFQSEKPKVCGVYRRVLQHLRGTTSGEVLGFMQAINRCQRVPSICRPMQISKLLPADKFNFLLGFFSGFSPRKCSEELANDLNEELQDGERSLKKDDWVVRIRKEPLRTADGDQVHKWQGEQSVYDSDSDSGYSSGYSSD